MTLRTLPYPTLRSLICAHISTEETEAAAMLVRTLRPARKRGYLTLAELEKVCRWKSPRVIGHIRTNNPAAIRAASRAALGTRSERRRLEALTSLTGVSIPMASAVLTVLNPKRYGVIDIRVWQLLYRMGAVGKKRSGTNFGFSNWYQYLMIVRYFAQELGVKARDVERTLFMVHKKYQSGILYRARPRTASVSAGRGTSRRPT